MMDDNDELAQAAFGIPDLQVSDLQREGPYFLPKDQDSLKPHYYQYQTKFKSLYKLKNASIKLISKINQNQTIIKSHSFDHWKKETFSKTIDIGDFLFFEKLSYSLKTFKKKNSQKLSRFLFRWKLLTLERIQERGLNQKLHFLNEEELKLKEVSFNIRSEIKLSEEQLKNNTFSRIEVGVFKESPYESLLKLRRENSLLNYKLKQASALFSSYLKQIQTISNLY